MKPAVKIEPRKLPGEWVKEGCNYDCTSFIGPMDHHDKRADWPMYSYDRPSSMLWNAIAGALNQRGWTDAEIKEWLQSKHPRWALDGDLGDLLAQIGKLYGANCSKV